MCGVETAVLKFGGFLEAQVLLRVLGGLQGGEWKLFIHLLGSDVILSRSKFPSLNLSSYSKYRLLFIRCEKSTKTFFGKIEICTCFQS